MLNNVNNKASVKFNYSNEIHKEYLADDNNNDSFGGIIKIPVPMICIIKTADEDGDFDFRHGYFTGSEGDFDSDIYIAISRDCSYDALIDEIISAANGNL